MGLFDSLGGLLNGQAGGAMDIVGKMLNQGQPGASSGVLGGLLGGLGGQSEGGGGDGAEGGQGGGIAGMLEQLAANGLGDHVSSWLSNNPNLPIHADQIRDALGSDKVRELAQSSGLPVGDFLDRLAEHLPGAVNEQAGTSAD